jgi:hypothetical protein
MKRSEEAKMLYEQNMTAKEIASIMNINIQTVYGHLNREGVNLGYATGPRTILSKDSINEILALRGNNHWGYQKIANKFHLSRDTIKKICEENGLIHEDFRKGKYNVHFNNNPEVIDKNGYVNVRIPSGDPYYEMNGARGTCMKHRYVMAKSLGRILEPNETVHHIDGNRQNNDISNLQLRKSNHGPGQKYECGDCGSHNIVLNKV